MNNKFTMSRYSEPSNTIPIPIKSKSEPLQNSTLRFKKKPSTIKPPPEFSLEHVNQDHVADFLQALSQDPLGQNDSGPEYISASSELVPPLRSIKPRRDKKKKKKQDDIGTPKGISHTLLKYPFILVIGSIMFVELVLYLGLRQTVRIWESLFSWRGRRRILRNHLRSSTSYEEWCRAAKDLDNYMNKEEWKSTPAYGYYDYRLIQKVIKHLRLYRERDDPESANNLKDVLYACLKQNFAGIENAKLYSNTYLGTKYLIEDYVNEVTQSIESLASSPHISDGDKRLAFRLYSKNYGRSAFCLSGGAGFGYFHLGVIRALLDRNLLPSIITGTSAGSLMGAIVCTRTDDELRQVLVPDLAQRIQIAQGSWTTKLRRYATTGALFDSEQWCRDAMWFTRGSLTFKEAYDRTGRIFNVSVIPYDAHSPSKLLNYITAPNCVIWSAVLASAAIPGILNPVVLMQKVPNSDRLVPYNYGHRFKDGSLRTDIPAQALHNHFNVNYTVVSQVNPHIHIFFYANQGSPGRPVTHRSGKGWRGGFLASTMEQVLKLELSKWLKVLRDLDLLPKLLNQDWSSIWLQKFDGDVTILPKAGITDWFYILADPDDKRLSQLMKYGQLQTWPKIAMIRNRLRIENSIELCRRKIRNTIKSSRKQTDSSTKKNYLFHHEFGSGGSDDGASGDEARMMDEVKFLSGRRLSMPDGMVGSSKEGQRLLNEEQQRLDFLSQFTDGPGLGLAAMENSVTMNDKDNHHQNQLIPNGKRFNDFNDMDDDTSDEEFVLW
ncbi:acyl transferase/acyl hydrolase/lysophospholipase [Halteromyces radiatus]|uniref:acyl transferase/acyl hydrolase/lysophospholipase n=1 Tax=Halteromyces radiatus TaxID=101107 RepID=UPI00221E9C29|nr:acyl transferase/acyl hydrolase/lysophospholipase [Halteromyces radiatus]KAI8086550.1 acyl transferase/acyl hydrolase/lysophospholipase [Halteromyces radiatus]